MWIYTEKNVSRHAKTLDRNLTKEQMKIEYSLLELVHHSKLEHKPGSEPFSNKTHSIQQQDIVVCQLLLENASTQLALHIERQGRNTNKQIVKTAHPLNHSHSRLRFFCENDRFWILIPYITQLYKEFIATLTNNSRTPIYVHDLSLSLSL